MRKSLLWIATSGAFVVTFSGGAAWAQSETAVGGAFARNSDVSVRQRPRPDYDALGVRAGAFLVFPKAELSEAYEDNIFAQPTNRVTDWITRFAPSVTAESQWSRNALNANLQLNHFQYASNSTQNNTTYAASADGRLDVVRGTNLTGGLSYQHLVEPRSSASSPANAKDPVSYNQTGVDFGASREVNQIRLSGAVHYRNYDFNNTTSFSGAVIDQSYRSNRSWEETVRADYALSPALAVYATATHDDWSFHRPLLATDTLRDAAGEQYALGVDFQATRLMRGQIQAGYLDQRFADPRVGAATGLAFLGRVEYFPTQLVTLTFNGERSVQATGVIGSPASLHSALGAQGDYELFRNLILTARAQRATDDYQGLDRTDRVWSAALGGNYLFNRRLGLNLLYTYYDQRSSGAARGLDFAVNRIQLGLVVQY